MSVCLPLNWAKCPEYPMLVECTGAVSNFWTCCQTLSKPPIQDSTWWFRGAVVRSWANSSKLPAIKKHENKKQCSNFCSNKNPIHDFKRCEQNTWDHLSWFSFAFTNSHLTQNCWLFTVSKTNPIVYSLLMQVNICWKVGCFFAPWTHRWESSIYITTL